MHVNDLVSVGIPAYNEEAYLEELLLSIGEDKYKHKEIIISDNGSKDSTWKIIQNFKKKYNDAFVISIIQQEKNKGAFYNFNYVLRASKGEFFIWAGGHDVWGPNMIQECVTILKKNRNIALAMPLVKWIDSYSNFLDLKHSTIDTTSGKSAAKRVLNLIFQYDGNCTAVYGLHRKNILLNTMPWPSMLGSDNLALVRVAKQGDIAPVKSTTYLRRIRLNETNEHRINRQLNAGNVKGLAYQAPYTVHKIRMFLELISARGSISERRQLFIEGFHRYLGLSLLRTIVYEFFPELNTFFKKLKVSLKL